MTIQQGPGVGSAAAVPDPGPHNSGTPEGSNIIVPDSRHSNGAALDLGCSNIIVSNLGLGSVTMPDSEQRDTVVASNFGFSNIAAPVPMHTDVFPQESGLRTPDSQHANVITQEESQLGNVMAPDSPQPPEVSTTTPEDSVDHAAVLTAPCLSPFTDGSVQVALPLLPQLPPAGIPSLAAGPDSEARVLLDPLPVPAVSAVADAPKGMVDCAFLQLICIIGS